MTGPEHYKEAERLLALAEIGAPALIGDVTVDETPRAATIAAAHVHATLALAAATDEAAGSYCAHGNRGVCMHCLMPLIEQAVSR